MLEPFWVYFLWVWKWTVFLNSIATASFVAFSSSPGPWNIPGVQPADTRSCRTAEFSLCGARLNLPTWLLRHFFSGISLVFSLSSARPSGVLCWLCFIYTWHMTRSLPILLATAVSRSLIFTCHFSEPFRTVFSSLFLFFSFVENRFFFHTMYSVFHSPNSSQFLPSFPLPSGSISFPYLRNKNKTR